MQKRAAGALQEGKDILIQSQTGSGKTLAFLLPLLSVLQYPPELYPDDLKVRRPAFCKLDILGVTALHNACLSSSMHAR